VCPNAITQAPVSVAASTTAVAPKDCQPNDPKLEPPAIPFNERSIPEGTRLAEEAKGKLKLAEGAELERSLREQYTTDGVAELITALKADPYNVTATYSLAAAYAHMGRSHPRAGPACCRRAWAARAHVPARSPHLGCLAIWARPVGPNAAVVRFSFSANFIIGPPNGI